MSTKSGWRYKAIVEAILTVSKHRTETRLVARFVENVDTVASTVATRNTLRLLRQAESTLTKLAHSSLTTERVHTHAQRKGTVNTTVSRGTNRSEAWGLEGENLV